MVGVEHRKNDFEHIDEIATEKMMRTDICSVRPIPDYIMRTEANEDSILQDHN